MPAPIAIPPNLVELAKAHPSANVWLDELPHLVQGLCRKWDLQLGSPYPEATCSWVAPARRNNEQTCVLKLGWPHFESRDEAEALSFWDGIGTVRVLERDVSGDGLLLESCRPGRPLSKEPEPVQDEILAELLKKIWRVPTPGLPFRPLSDLTDYWTESTLRAQEHWPDSGLVLAGLELFKTLNESAKRSVLLCTDLHAGNVLSAERAPWLAIDPKPFVGDPAYDATQHLWNCKERMLKNPLDTIRRFADLLEVDWERVQAWFFARGVAEPREPWGKGSNSYLRALAP